LKFAFAHGWFRQNPEIPFNTNDITAIMLCIGLALAIIHLPAGFCASKVANRRVMVGGIILTIFSILLMVYMRAEIPMLLFTAEGLSLIVSLIDNGVIPFILELMPPRWASLGIGSYFGGSSLVVSVFGYVFTPGITIIVSCIADTLAFLLADMCIFLPRW
jgi:predicted MFS family arabinose efflux permease